MKEVRFFYVPDAQQQTELPPDEAMHAMRVLRLKGNMHWLEVVLGIDAKVFGPLHLGWTVRYKRRLMHNDGALDATWYVPGFGINDKDNIGANFNVIIDI